MRILHDEHGMTWEKAWSIVIRTFAYTNHTLLPEALEPRSVALFQKVVPRHLQLIFEINKRFMVEVEAKWPGDAKNNNILSLIRGRPCVLTNGASFSRWRPFGQWSGRAAY